MRGAGGHGKICTRAHAALCCSPNIVCCLAVPGPFALVALSRRIEAAVLCARSFSHFVLEVSKCMAGSLSAGLASAYTVQCFSCVSLFFKGQISDFILQK